MVIDGSSFYMQSEDRCGGIRVQSAQPEALHEGDRVSVIGTVKVSDGEAFVGDAMVSVVGDGTAPAPVFIRNDNLGGGALGVQPAMQAFAGTSRTPVEASGPNSIGLLVKTFGRITHTGSGYFYIDDGAGLDDGDPNVKGIKVAYPYPANVGDYAVVTGVSSCFTKNGIVARQIRPRRAGDILVL